MKKITLAAVSGLLCTGICGNAAERGKSRDIEKLWSEYRAAEKKDLPQKSAAVLQEIIGTARNSRRSYDFYLAWEKYVDVQARRNWKTRDELDSLKKAEFIAYGDPMVLYESGTGIDKSDPAEVCAFLDKWEKSLRASSSKEFWSAKPLVSKEKVLSDHIRNDYEQILLSAAMGSTWQNGECPGLDRLMERLRKEYPEEYPVIALVELHNLNERKSSDCDAFIMKYNGTAAATLAKCRAAALKFNELESSDAGEEEFLELRKHCQALVREMASYSGEEKLIVKGCVSAERTIEKLEASDFSVRITDGEIVAMVRNLPDINVSIYAGEGLTEKKIGKKDTPVHSCRLVDEKRRFHVADTLTAKLPEFSDGEYLAIFEASGMKRSANISQYSIALSAHRAAEGWMLYAADRKSGMPLDVAEVVLRGRNDEELLRKTVRFSGATLLDQEFQSALKTRKPFSIECRTTGKDGLERRSRGLRIYGHDDGVSSDARFEYQAHVLTDCSAYRPGGTVNFKAIVYKDFHNGKMNTAPEGEKIRAVLLDAQRNEVSSLELLTNSFGSVAGTFPLPVGRRNGEWQIAVRCGDNALNAKWFTVDEFKLPDFSATFENDGVKYFPGDEIPVKGHLSSYAGNSLSDAVLEYSISSWNRQPVSGTPDVDELGNFTIPVKTGEGYGNYLTVTLKVTDGAGQTLEFSKWLGVSEDFEISAELEDAAEGEFNVNAGGFPEPYYWRRNRTGSGMLKGDAAVLDVKIEDSGDATIDGELNWKLTHEGKVLREGVCLSGKKLRIDLSGERSGLYTVEFSKTYGYVMSGQKKTSSQKYEYQILKLDENDSVLDADIENVFKVLDEKDRISLLFGAAHGEVWANVMVFDIDSHTLANETVHLGGIRGQDSSLRKLSWEHRGDWSDRVLLRMEYFRDGRYWSFTKEYTRAQDKFSIPLSVSTFTDKCLPCTEYRVKLRTSADVEVLAAIFDKSTEDIRSNVWSAVMPSFRSIGIDSGRDTGCAFEGYAYSSGMDGITWRSERRMMSKSSVNLAEGVACETEDCVLSEMVVAAPMAAGMADDSVQNADAVRIRKDFQKTLAFEPFLHSDSEGNVEFTFRTSDKLSTYILSLFAHDKSVHNAVLRQEFIVSQPLTITVHEPSLLYGGDRYMFRPAVSNNSGKKVSGMLTVYVYDGDGAAHPISVQNCPVEVEAGESLNKEFAVFVEEATKMNSYSGGKAKLGIRTVFSGTAGGTEVNDAIYVEIPVLDGKQVLTEAHSAVYRHGKDKAELLRSLEKSFVNTSAYGAVTQERSIRELVRETLGQKTGEPRSCNLLDVSEVLYAKLVADSLGKEDTDSLGREVTDTPGKENTDSDTGQLVGKLLSCRNSDGGFAWFAEMPSSPVLTAVVLERLALLRDRGLLPEGTDWNGMFAGAVHYADSMMFKKCEGYCCYGGISVEEYVYMRSFFPETAVDTRQIKSDNGNRRFMEVTKEIRSCLYNDGSLDFGHDSPVMEKARRSATALRLLTAPADDFASSVGLKSRKMKKRLRRDIASLKEYAVEHPCGGYFYPNAVMPFRAMLSSEAYAHSIICDMLTGWSAYTREKLGKTDVKAGEIADGLRLWLLVQKENQKWDCNFEFVNAVNSILEGSPALMETEVISMSKTYEKPFEEIRSAGNGFRISRTFLVEDRDAKDADSRLRELRTGETLSVGQKVTIRYSIHSDENRSLVHISTPYDACLRPVRQLSGSTGYLTREWRINSALSGFRAWWVTPAGYREVHEDAVDWWFDVYPEEDTTIEDEFYVTQAGIFTAPVCEIESLYAPHYRANSAFDGSLAVRN